MSNPAVTEVDESTFNESVSDSDVPVLVAFIASWSGPCRLIAPVLDEIAKEQGNAVRLLTADVDNHPVLSNRFGIQNVPTMLFFKGGELSDQVVGVTSKKDLIYRLGALK
jgi:thioredoxin 1